MEELVEIVNQLQEVFNVSSYKNVDLPQIVVVGSQSAGKSSVLENIVGRSFLPRGAGIVTRCPLVLQLTRSEKEYAKFQHDEKSTEFTDFSLIREEIEEQTVRLAGSSKGICSTPITLKLFSPNHLDLTLVDLPGLTKVPVPGQPEDIGCQIEDLVMTYVTNPNSIILAIVPANQDMATSESLKIAREVDPDGKRTLAVLTKIDLMDKGTNAYDMLSGKVIPVKLGIIGVVNRSQKDIKEHKSVSDALKDETSFFKENYENIYFEHGTLFLRKRVQEILINHIKIILPKLKKDITKQLEDRHADLLTVGKNKLDEFSEMMVLLRKFSTTYCSVLKGNQVNDDFQTKKLYGGARIKNIFQEKLGRSLESTNNLNQISEKIVIASIKNATGISSGLLVPEGAFESLVKQQIKKLHSPCEECVELISEEFKSITDICIQDSEIGLAKYPKFQEEISDIVSDFIAKKTLKAKKMVKRFVEVQLSYVNTSHPDFISNVLENEYAYQTTSTKVLHEVQKNKDYKLMLKLVRSYLSIVNESIKDIIPKMVMYYLINHVMDNLDSELARSLTKNDLTDLLKESSEISKKRERLNNEITTLEKASKILVSIKPSLNRKFN